MKWIMSLAAGLAIGYFVYQSIVSRNGGRRITGRLHKSLKDKKVAGALMVVGWGSGLLAYIICAVILPEGDDEEEDADEETEE